MGQRYPTCNANDVIRVLRRKGFAKVGQKGSHQKRHEDGRQVIVADHGSNQSQSELLKA
jgi:predicted RNA binding protein YcfA (HicA-like mRNA interferase family)